MIQSFLSFIVKGLLKLVIFVCLMFGMMMLGAYIADSLSVTINEIASIPENTLRYSIIAPMFFLALLITKILFSALKLEQRVNTLFGLPTAAH